MHYENAMVIGASLAGMCAARVLADHFGRVTLLERDRLPETAESRPGVPQDRHVHVLLARGATIMSRLFPGIADDLVAAGAQPVDLTYDGVGRMRGRWLQRFKSGHLTYACSRVLLESVVRRRLRALPNVTIHAGARVTGLALQGARVAGVQVQWRDGRSPGVETADFIVDASGRGAKTADWLAALGYGEVTETVVDARLG
ncbi:MAG: FAD-dependent monooxygenase, partial [Anaerolineales bacterium]|nr:FAD-dependent monooxygenase [Anaerolineales bacterium]